MMKLPCGTLAYVAPEVLIGKGYDQEADVWSVGVILYLLISGKLPFDSPEKRAIIDKTLHCQLPLKEDVWVHASSSCRDLIKGLMDKDPKTRLTAQQAREHVWFKKGGSHKQVEAVEELILALE